MSTNIIQRKAQLLRAPQRRRESVTRAVQRQLVLMGSNRALGFIMIQQLSSYRNGGPEWCPESAQPVVIAALEH